MKGMNKETLLKKWIKQANIDEKQLYDVTMNTQNTIDFYSWEKNDPRLKIFHALERRL